MKGSMLTQLKENSGVFLHRLGISANLLTGLGLGLAALSGWLIYHGGFFWAGVFLFLSGLLDLLDGSVARAAKTSNRFGGILDSSLDRYGDGFIFFGILFFCAMNEYWLYAVLAMSALLGSFSISYVRARAECEVSRCQVGFWERGERLVYVGFGLLFGNLPMVLWVLGLATHWTAWQRLYESRRLCGNDSDQNQTQTSIVKSSANRTSGAYFLKITVLFLAVLFLRVSF